MEVGVFSDWLTGRTSYVSHSLSFNDVLASLIQIWKEKCCHIAFAASVLCLELSGNSPTLPFSGVPFFFSSSKALASLCDCRFLCKFVLAFRFQLQLNSVLALLGNTFTFVCILALWVVKIYFQGDFTQGLGYAWCKNFSWWILGRCPCPQSVWIGPWEVQVSFKQCLELHHDLTSHIPPVFPFSCLCS